MSYYYEKYYPIVFSIIITTLFFYFQVKMENIDETVKKLLDSALAICGALLGFLLTILTLINTIETRRMRFVKQSGTFPTLNHYLKVALFLNLLSISIYFIHPILNSIKAIAVYKSQCYTCTVFIISFTWLANIRFTKIFIRLLTDPKPY